MSIISEIYARHHDRLAGFPTPLQEQFEAGLRALAPRLSQSQLQIWAETGVDLTALNLRSWETAVEFFRVGASLPERATWDAIETLGREARKLADESAPLAIAFLRSAPAAIELIGPSHLGQWADMGRRMYKGNWKSASLAGQFYDLGPELFGVLRMSQLSRLVLFVSELARHSYELASSCLGEAPNVLGRIEDEDRLPFIAFAVELAQSSWADSRLYFERGAPLLEKVHHPMREPFLLLAALVARDHSRSAFEYFEEGARALGELEPDDHHAIISLAQDLSAYSPSAAMDFIKAVPSVLGRIRMDELEAWQAAGLRILQQSHEGGEAYFRLESTRGEGVLETLSARVELSKVGEILRLYCKALTGRNLSVHSTSALAEKGIGWVDQQKASTEGTTIYLPEVIERYNQKDENFAAMKVFATHQTARIEFGSFEFVFDRPGALFETRRPAGNTPSHAVTDIERFFDLFPDRELASDLFAIVEDSRVDAAIKREYGGIRGPLTRMQQSALGVRPDVREMPLRMAFVENLVRASLDSVDAVQFPEPHARVMGQGLSLLSAISNPTATVEDSAEAALRLYTVAMSIPNVMPGDEDAWDDVEAGDEMEQEYALDDFGESSESSQIQPGGEPMEGEEEYESPEDVDYRGDFKPELVQLLMKMRKDAQGSRDGEMQSQPLTEEQLKELMEKSKDFDMNVEDGDIDRSAGLFMQNLLKEAGTPTTDKDAKGDKSGDDSTGEDEAEEDLKPVVTVFYYDEWDFRAQDYKPRWCAVKEAKLEQGTDNFYETTLHEHAGLVAQTRKQFELMKPELFRKIKRLPDGEDFDLDAAIEWMVEKRSGANPQEKIYWRRNKIERDVAVAFLVDMSASTDEEINKKEKTYDDDFDGDPRQYLSWWAARKKQQESVKAPKRIIDLEKESTVLLMTALETIGDQYGIFGFSGYGRDNVEFFVIKDFDERLDDPIKKRLDKVVPIRSTRMGPAIRHATHKLQLTEAKVKILVLLSDGRPQDHGYGRDRTEKEYAIHDTKQALNEAKRIGITPFALTVDRAGHDYLKTMCEDMGYEVVADIEALPSRLPALYRQLTE